MDIKIIVASHKEYAMPDDPVYVPVMAGSALRKNVPDMYARDDEGNNISHLNRSYCELTALYWAWKNLKCDALGLCHYRRYFASPGCRTRLLSGAEADKILKNYDIILPKARNYVIETSYSQYAHAHHSEDLDAVRQIISEKCPEYLNSFDRRMKMRGGHRFNMFIMRKNLADEYCEWLFSLLSELTGRLDTSCYSRSDVRAPGLTAERLLDVWIDKKDLRCKELSYIFIENEHIVMKALKLVLRKIKSQI